MDLNKKMAELDARMAARREAVDRRLGIVPDGGASAAPSPDVVPPSSPESPPAPVCKKNDAFRNGKASQVIDDLGGGLDFFGLFTIPGIVIQIVFVLLCLAAVLGLFWALRCLLGGWGYGCGYWLGDALINAFLAWGLWRLCTHKGK